MNRNTFIDVLRFAAIMIIVIDHSFFMLEFHRLFDTGIVMGYIGVSIFFFLSGYLTKMKSTPTKFLKDKLIKLYPIYFVVMIATILTSTAVIHPYYQIVYPLMLQAFYPFSSKILWFISGLFVAYVLYAAQNYNEKLFAILTVLCVIEWVYIGNFRMILMILLFFLGNYLRDYDILEFNWKPNKIINTLGASTLAIYLCHVLIISPMLNYNNDPWLMYLIYIPAMLVLAVIIQYGYDNFQAFLYHRH